MRNSFTLRLTLRVALLVTLTTALVLLTGGGLLKRQGIKSLELLQNVEGEELVSLLHSPTPLTDAEIKHRLENEADSDIALFFIQVCDTHGQVLYRSANLGEAYIPGAPSRQNRWTTPVGGAGAVRVTEFPVDNLRILIGSALSPVTHILHDYTRIALLLTFLTGVLSLLLGYALSRVTLAPIRAIERTARRISADNLSERIPVPDVGDEISSLAVLLNHTFDNLESSFAQIRRFSSDVSHELKTPLALIRLEAEKLRALLADGTRSDTAELDTLLADILVEADHMNRVIESLLFIARTEGGALVIKREKHDMPEFITTFSEDACALAEDCGVRFLLARNDAGAAPIDPQTLRQLLLNLTSNALAVSSPGSTVALESIRAGTGWILTMTDEGPGLPEHMLERVFERFTRHAGTAAKHGHGLGLPICRSIAELHHGTLRAENRTDRAGLRVTMEWPS